MNRYVHSIMHNRYTLLFFNILISFIFCGTFSSLYAFIFNYFKLNYVYRAFPVIKNVFKIDLVVICVTWRRNSKSKNFISTILTETPPTPITYKSCVMKRAAKRFINVVPERFRRSENKLQQRK